MLAKINSISGAIFVLALVLLFSGCTPAGPRALLKGKKYLDRGNVADAIIQLKRATTLLSTNAQAWNYLGVALQRGGQPDEAATSYQTALKLDRDLVETHYNLGVLYVEQNKAELAKAELTTYTLLRRNDPAGWLKLGVAQLKAGEILPAQRSFSTVLSLKTNEAEAYNGLGLASVQAGKPRDGAQFFIASLQARADFAPALLNLATVNQQYLHDNRAALTSYQAYLAAAPRAANYSEVKAIVASLTQSDVAATVMAPAVIVKTSTPAQDTKPRNPPVTTPVVATTSRPQTITRPETPETYPANTRTPSRPANNPATTPAPVVPQAPTQTVQVPPERTIVATPPKTNPPSVHPVAVTLKPVTKPVTNNPEPVEAPMPEEQPKKGFWHRVFGNNEKPVPAAKPQVLTPIPTAATNDQMADTKPEEEKPAETKPAPVISVPRYSYQSPAKPAAGERRNAEGAFTKARLAEQDENWPDALQWYQSAADTDAAWFEAQYNAGVIAHRLRNYSTALPRYELALAIQPESIDARYNFALALKASGYPADAAEELRKILVLNPDEVRAHLALANLCAQSLHDVPQARQHYLKVLSLQPNNPQAPDIRFWLSANTK